MKNFWQNKKVLITGHTGFKGAWLSYILSGWGAKVVGVALPPSDDPNLFSALKLEDHLAANYFTDIRNYKEVKEIVDREQPEIVFHLAAQPIVREGYRLPLTTHSTNIMGTAHVLQSLVGVRSVRAAVIITTDKVYENKEWVYPYREEEPLGGYDPYSASKAAADIVSQSYIRSFFNPKDYGDKHAALLGIARAGNVIGGGDWSCDRLVPDIIRAVFVDKKPVTLRSPRAIRPWQHVLECLGGYMLLAERLYQGDKTAVGAWNFGPAGDEDEATVEEVVEKALDYLGTGTYQVNEDEASQGKHEASLLKLDINKAKQILDWHPKWGFNQAIRETFVWYKKFYSDPQSIAQLTQEQIKKYFSK